MKDLFHLAPSLIVFLHVISAVIWVGGMIAIRFSVHYSLIKIDEPEIRLGRTLELLKRFFDIAKYLIVVILITALIMIFGLEFKGTPLNSFVHIKELIWTIMTIIFIIIYIRRNRAQNYFDNGQFQKAKEALAPIAAKFIPVNIVLGMAAVYLGITLRGF